jgi:hypothetical protein
LLNIQGNQGNSDKAEVQFQHYPCELLDVLAHSQSSMPIVHLRAGIWTGIGTTTLSHRLLAHITFNQKHSWQIKAKSS